MVKSWSAAALWTLCVVPLAEAEFNAMLRLVPEYHQANRDSPFFLPEEAAVFPSPWLSRHELELGYRYQGFNGQVLLRNEVRSGSEPLNKAILNELYWDTQLLEQDISLGKKVLSWGVGFGFRPLDVIQRENRRRLYAEPLEGVPLLAWESFGTTTAITLVIANPHHDSAEQARDEASLAAKFYKLWGEADLHSVLRFSERQRLEAGGGISQVVGDTLEWHTSVLYQHRYERLANPLVSDTDALLALTDPLQTEIFDHGLQVLAGGSWTSANGWSLLTEFWYDKQAYSEDDWQAIATLTKQQRALLGLAGVPDQAVFSNIAASSRYFQATNLQRWNSLVRLSHTGGNITPALDVLYTPEDGGYVLTFNIGYENNRQRLDLAFRRYAGPDNAAYRLLPEQWLALVAWEWALY